VQNVSVGDGGKAIVGNVTQHASVTVSDEPERPPQRFEAYADVCRGARKHDPVRATSKDPA